MSENKRNPEVRKKRIIIICIVIAAVLAIGGLAIHAVREKKVAETHVEYDLGDVSGAID